MEPINRCFALADVELARTAKQIHALADALETLSLMLGTEAILDDFSEN